MKKGLVKGLFIVLIYMGTISIAMAEDIIEIDCPSNTNRPTTALAYAYSSFDDVTNTETYSIDLTNKEGSYVMEYCVYPTPAYGGSTDDITALYGGWSVYHHQNNGYFGFEKKNTPAMPLDGSSGIQVGSAIYAGGQPSSKIILLHISDPEECTGSGPTCWRIASTGISPTPTVTATVTPTVTATVTPTVTATVTPTVTATVTPTVTATVTPTVTATVTPTVTATPTGDTQPPSQPLCPVAVATGPTTIDLSWWASTDNVGVVGYKIYRGTSPEILYYLTTVTGLSYTDTGRTTGVTYYYVIVAIDAANNPSLPSDEVYATPRDISSPVVTIPANMVIEATSPSGATATFVSSAIDDIDGPITSTCNPSSGSIFQLGITTITCTATDSAGNEASAIFSITVVDTTPPTTPSGLTATAISTSRIDLSWNPSTDIVGVTQYVIYRGLDGVNFAPIRSVTGTTYQNFGLSSGITYYYYVVALDRAGNPSSPSNTASATTLTPPTPTPTASPGPTSPPGPTPTIPPPTPTPDYAPIITVPANMIVEATSPSGAMAAFSVSAYDNEDAESKPVTCIPASGSTFPLGLTIVSCDATDSVGNMGYATFQITVVDTTPPTTPSGLIATAMSTTRIDLSWSASYDAVGVNRYEIFRSLDGASFSAIGTRAGTTFINSGLIPNTTYYYYVIAYDNVSNPSDPSNTANARTFPQPPSPPPTPSPIPTISTPGPTTTAVNPCLPAGNTPSGQNIEASPVSAVNIKFDTVLECGETTAVAYYDDGWTPLPENYERVLLYDIQTTATYADYITIKVTYSDSDIPSGVSEESLRLFHYEDGNWIDVTTALDTTSNIITGRVSSLSPFAIAGLRGSSSGGGSGGSDSGIKGIALSIYGYIMLAICLIGLSRLEFKKH